MVALILLFGLGGAIALAVVVIGAVEGKGRGELAVFDGATTYVVEIVETRVTE